jgi:type I restriction enzyme S subunit
MSMTAKSSVDSVRMEMISDMELVVPSSIREQEVIAAALSDADAAIESLDALITKKRDVKQATMQQLLTGRIRLPGFTADWKEVRLGEVVRFTRKTLDPFLLGEKVVEHFSIPAYDAGRAELVPASTIKSLKMLLDEECVLVSRLNPRIPRVWHVLPGSHEALASTEFMPVVPNAEMMQPYYLMHLFLSDSYTQKLKEMAIGTTGSHQRVQPGDVLALFVNIPPLKEQEAIAETLSAMDDELEALTEQVSKLRMVKEGMMQDLLTGKVRLV